MIVDLSASLTEVERDRDSRFRSARSFASRMIFVATRVIPFRVRRYVILPYLWRGTLDTDRKSLILLWFNCEPPGDQRTVAIAELERDREAARHLRRTLADDTFPDREAAESALAGLLQKPAQ